VFYDFRACFFSVAEIFECDTSQATFHPSGFWGYVTKMRRDLLARLSLSCGSWEGVFSHRTFNSTLSRCVLNIFARCLSLKWFRSNALFYSRTIRKTFSGWLDLDYLHKRLRSHLTGMRLFSWLWPYSVSFRPTESCVGLGQICCILLDFAKSFFMATLWRVAEVVEVGFLESCFRQTWLRILNRSSLKIYTPKT